jgi:hypothetical protein
MIDYIKWYVVQVGMKKYVPMGVMAALASLGAIMAAHAGMLEQWGVTYGNWPLNFGTSPTGPCIVIELDTLSKAVIAGIASLAAMAMAATQHHTTGTPSVIGGRRAIDPPPVHPAEGA